MHLDGIKYPTAQSGNGIKSEEYDVFLYILYRKKIENSLFCNKIKQERFRCNVSLRAGKICTAVMDRVIKKAMY